MKKIVLMLIVLCYSATGYAQQYWDGSRADKLVTLGVRAGLNISKKYAMDDQADEDFALGYRIGLALDLNLAHSFSVNTGVLFEQKGWKHDYSDSRGKIETSDKATYLVVPLQGSYRVELSDKAQFQLNLGPYFAFGMGGKTETTNSFQAGGNYEVDSFDENVGRKKFDAGIAVGAAITYSGIYVGIGYDRGLINTSQAGIDKFQNGSIHLTLGYNL